MQLRHSDVVCALCNNCIHVHDGVSGMSYQWFIKGGSQSSLTASNHGSIYFVRKSWMTDTRMKSHTIRSISVSFWLLKRRRDIKWQKQGQAQIIRIIKKGLALHFTSYLSLTASSKYVLNAWNIKKEKHNACPRVPRWITLLNISRFKRYHLQFCDFFNPTSTSHEHLKLDTTYLEVKAALNACGSTI